MPLIMNGVSWVLLVAGAGFMIVSAVGVIRFPDFFTRLHAASIADTLGVMLILTGLMFQAGFSQVTLKLLLILAFILITSPTATHALAKAALHGGVEPLLSEEEEPPSKP